MHRILIVDDEILTADAIFRELSALLPDEVALAKTYSAQDARTYIERNEADIVLCDIEMPGISGLEFLEWIKVYHPGVECIMLTCHAEFDYLRQAMRLGCFDYVLKPIDYGELSEVIGKAIEKLEWERQISSEPAQTGELQTYLRQIFKERKQSGEADRPETLEAKVKEYIHDHMIENISVKDIADHVGFSQSHLMKLFKAQTGISVLQCITCERLDVAKELLERTDLAVSEVGCAAGYDNYSYFIKLFKRETGMTPMQYRRVQSNTIAP